MDQDQCGQLSITVVPDYFHIIHDGEVTCGMGSISITSSQNDTDICARCRMGIDYANRTLAGEIKLQYDDLDIESMVMINELLRTRPSVSGREIVRVLGIEHVRVVPRPISAGYKTMTRMINAG